MDDPSQPDYLHIEIPIGCLDTEHLRAVLMPSSGYHCDVWRVSRVMVHEAGRRSSLDYVIKRHREPAGLQDARILHNDYLKLKADLEDIVPDAVFLWTQVGDAANCVVIAEAVHPWFNIANPANEEDLIPLLARLPKAQVQLEAFLDAARRWDNEEGRVIDLWGLDNLVLDVNHEIRYIDSFRVFFFEDLLHAIESEDDDDGLAEKINVSRQRRLFLQYILEEARPG